MTYNSDRPVRPRRAMRGTLRHNRSPSAHVVIGFAHVASGAWGIFDVFSQGLFKANGMPFPSSLAIAVGGLASLLLVLGGLWLADGRRRGALLAVGMDGLRVLASLLVGATASTSFVASLALGVAVVWVWPRLDRVSSA